jgi:hypothetical protein
MSRKIKLDNVLPLKHFIRQQGVVKLYRDFLRAARYVAPADARAEIDRQIKFEFRKNQSLTDVIVVKSLITEAHRNLKLVVAMNPKSHQHDKDAWINSSTEDDKRGRVGEGWPWG